MKPSGLAHPLRMRVGASSDAQVLWDIFLLRAYRCLENLEAPRLILDLGANVGYSSAYFLSRFPFARVVAVEPDPGNAAICQANLAPYGARATVVEGAVWPERSRLRLVRGTFGDGREWATQVRGRVADDGGPAVEGWDIPSLLEITGAGRVDLLKIDIERSELELFNCHTDRWLPWVDNICIELHGDDCRVAFFSALEEYDFDATECGELTICRNLRAKAVCEKVDALPRGSQCSPATTLPNG